MTRSLIVCTCVVLILSVAAARAEEKVNIIGTWLPFEGTLNGEKLTDDFLKSFKVIVAKDGYKAVVGEQTESGTYKIDTKAKPTTMDIAPSDGPQKGKTIKAIFELSGDTIKICYPLENGEQPKEFASTKDSKVFLVTYKRQK